MEEFQVYQQWIRQVIVPFYRIKVTADDLISFDAWAENFMERKVSISQLNQAFKVWRCGPHGEYPPSSTNLLKIIYPPEMGSAEEVAAKRELGRLKELESQAFADLYHCQRLTQEFCDDFNKKYGLRFKPDVYERLRADFYSPQRARCEAARKELLYYLAHAKK